MGAHTSVPCNPVVNVINTGSPILLVQLVARAEMIAAQEEGIQERQQQPQQISAAQLAMALSQAGVTGSQPSTSKTSFRSPSSAFNLHRVKLAQTSQHCPDSDQTKGLAMTNTHFGGGMGFGDSQFAGLANFSSQISGFTFKSYRFLGFDMYNVLQFLPSYVLGLWVFHSKFLFYRVFEVIQFM